MIKVSVVLAMLVTSFSSIADMPVEHRQWVENALAAVENNTDSNKVTWKYRQKTVSDDEIMIEHFDGEKPEAEQWTLISENGQTPDAKRVKEYLTDRQSTEKDENQHELKFADMVELSSLDLVSEDENEYIYKFTPNIKELESKALIGKLHLSKISKQVNQLIITNTSDLSPAFSVSLNKFELILSFHLFDGLNMPIFTSTSVKGTVAIFKSIESDQKVTYSDYLKIAAPNS